MVFKKLPLTVILLLLVSLAFGQLRYNPKFELNYPSLNVDHENFNADGRSGWGFGLDLRLEKNHIFFLPGFHVQKTKLELSSLDDPEADEYGTRFTSLKFPLNAGVYLTGPASLLRLHLRGGLIPQFVTGAQDVDQLGFSKNMLNGFTWGANAALGMDFIILNIEFSYEFGLSNTFDDINGKNNMAILSFGLIL